MPDNPTPASRPVRHPNTKRIGELAEAAFLVKVAGLGYAASKPWGDSERYDFILDTGNNTGNATRNNTGDEHRNHIWRVQIKCTQLLNARGYQVQSTYTDRKKKGHYTAADIDVLVAYILPLDLWYIIPAEAFPASASLRFYPEGNISGRPARFEQYREAWHLFRSAPIKDRHPEQISSCHPERSEGPTPKNICHPPENNASPIVPAPETVLDRMQRQWAERVTALYTRKT
jgi:PD-(D/E)XK endonuclease